MRFAVKHAIAAAVVISGIVAFSAVSYFALLALAVLMEEPLGGPFTFPFMVLLGLAASVVVTTAILFPVSALTEWICESRRLRRPWQIPLATILLAAWVLLLATLGSPLTGASPETAVLPTALAFLLLLVPLGAYWWSMQSAQWVLGLVVRRWGATRSGPST